MHSRRLIGFITVISFAAFVAAGCGNDVPKNAICSVNGEAITKKDFNKILGSAKKNYATQGQKFPKEGSEEYKQLKGQAVGYMIEQELYKQQGEELDVKLSDKDVDKRLKQLKESFFKGDQKAYKDELKKQGLTEEDVKENIEGQLLNEKLFNKVTKNVKISKAKAEAYFKENEAQFQTPESRDVAHILVKTKKEADKIYAVVKSGDEKVFAAQAKKFSQDPSSAQQGGTLTITKGQTVPEFDAMSFKLKKGAISEPVKTQFGYHIITARGDVKPASKKTFEESKEQINQSLLQEEKSKRMQDWRDGLLKKSKKDVNCSKGYVWSQTVKSTEQAPPAVTEAPEEAPTEETPTETPADEAPAGDADAKDESADKESSESKDK